MAFPTSSAPAATNVTTAAEPQTVNIGSPSVDDLLLAFGRVPASGNTSTFPTGWIKLKDVSQAGTSSDRIFLACKKLQSGDAEVGASTMSVDIDSGASTARLGAWLVWKIAGAANPAITPPEVSTEVLANSTTPNPGAITPAGGVAKDYLVFALACAEGEQTTPYTAVPTLYTLYQGSANSGTAGAVAVNCTMTGVARELNTGASIDPGTFTMNVADDWLAWTVIVHPAEATPPTYAYNTPSINHSMHMIRR